MARKANRARRQRGAASGARAKATAEAPAREPTAARRARREDDAFRSFLVGVGRRIAHLRVDAGFTQEQAAAEARMLLQQWQRLERGKTNATLQTMFEAAAVLDVPVSTIVTPLVERVPNLARPGRPAKRDATSAHSRGAKRS